MNIINKWQVTVLTTFFVAITAMGVEGAGATGGTERLLVPKFEVKCLVKVTSFSTAGKIEDPTLELSFSDKNFEQSKGNDHVQVTVSPSYQKDSKENPSFGYSIGLMLINRVGTNITISRNSIEAHGTPLRANTTTTLEIRDQKDKYGEQDLYQTTSVRCLEVK